MSKLSNILLDKEILLESGTNELEVLVFDVADYTFGINVAKVREVLPAAQITALPKAHRSIRGIFKLRNQVIPCVSLLDHLGITPARDGSESTMILTDLNQQQTAFLVDAVERIHRLSWENILAVPGLEALSHTPVTALARCDGRLIVMLDFEMILDDVTDQFFRTDAVDNPLGLAREKLRILLAEDSPTVREAIGATLEKSGYTQLTFFENGAEAWQWIDGRFRQSGRAEDVADLLICDVEMPQVDGLHLTRRVKEHAELKRIPVLLYSSIITPDNRKKGNAVGADAQVSKPELTKVVELADQLIAQSRDQSRASALRQIAGAAETGSKPVMAADSSSSPARDVMNQSPDGASGRTQPSAPPANQTHGSAVGPPVELCKPEPSTVPAAEPPYSSASAETCLVRHVAAPVGVRPRLWTTFHGELIGRAECLREAIGRTAACDGGEEAPRQIARTLHTIKSAAMVVPLDAVTRTTHLVESLLEAARDGRIPWPDEGLRRYLAWLDSLISPPLGIDAALAESEQLEGPLNALLSRSAC